METLEEESKVDPTTADDRLLNGCQHNETFMNSKTFETANFSCQQDSGPAQ